MSGLEFDSGAIIAILGALGAGGVAWGGARAGSRFVLAELKEIKSDFRSHSEADNDWQLNTEARLTRQETMMRDVHHAVIQGRRRMDP